MNATTRTTKEVADSITTIAKELGLVTWVIPSNHTDVQYVLLTKGATEHEIVVDVDGIQFRKTGSRRSRGATVKDTSDENIRKHLKELNVLLGYRDDHRKDREAKRAQQDRNVAVGRELRSQFTHSLRALGVTSGEGRTIEFDKVRDTEAFGQLRGFGAVEDGTTGISIFKNGRAVFTITYSRPEIFSRFSVESAEEAARIVRGLDAIFNR